MKKNSHKFSIKKVTGVISWLQGLQCFWKLPCLSRFIVLIGLFVLQLFLDSLELTALPSQSSCFSSILVMPGDPETANRLISVETHGPKRSNR